jgi:hypothetical protein
MGLSHLTPTTGEFGSALPAEREENGPGIVGVRVKDQQAPSLFVSN